MERVLPLENLKRHLLVAKPGIVLLSLITTLGGMLYAKESINLEKALWALLGTALCASGSAILNNLYDKDIDSKMLRTQSRPTALGQINYNLLLFEGASLLILSYLILYHFVSFKVALLGFIASFTYVFVYTMFLKRHSHWATEVGGITGALPPVMGYVAVKDSFDLNALTLFLILFLWQPPHFWVLALKYREDYRRAGVPTLPVSKGVLETKRRTLIYTLLLVLVSLMPYFLKACGLIYLIGALILGGIYLFMTLKFYKSKEESDMKLFTYSIIYLSLIFLLLVVGRWT